MKLYQQLRDLFSDTPLASANGNVYKSKTGQCFPFRDRTFTFSLHETVDTATQFVDAGSY